MPGPDGLTIATRVLNDRTILTLTDRFGRQTLYEFRLDRTCGVCGCNVDPEWFAHHAKWHNDERMRNFGGF